MPELSELVSVCHPHLIAVSETWLTSDVPDDMITPTGFNVVARADRDDDRRGGGVVLLARNDVRCIARPDLRNWSESVWIDLELVPPNKTTHSHKRNLVVGCFYRPPASNPREFVDLLDQSFDLIGNNREVLLVGDFNAACSSWLASDVTSTAGRILEPAFLSLGLYQCVQSPTHLSANGSLGSLLDLILTTSPDLISPRSINVLPPLGKSDHLPVLCHHRDSPGGRFLRL